MRSYHLLRSDLGLLALARDEGGAGHDRRADGGGRAESGPREGTEETGVHAGLSGGCRSAHGRGGPIGRGELAKGRMTYRTSSAKPGEMTGDGVAGGIDLMLSAVHGQKLESCGSGTAASRAHAGLATSNLQPSRLLLPHSPFRVVISLTFQGNIFHTPCRWFCGESHPVLLRVFGTQRL
jgi:hypothetical protein